MEQTENKTANALVAQFILSHRKVLIGILVALLTSAAAVGVTLSVLSVQKEKGLVKLDSIEFELTKLKDAEADKQKKAELLEELKTLAETTSGVVKTRSAMAFANAVFADGEHEKARTYWLTAADSQKDAYTSFICLYNAAVCSEELNDAETAVRYFDEAAQHKDFPLAARALFNAARIEEGRGNYAQAVEKYEKLNAEYADFAASDWGNLAKSRVIALRAAGKVH